MDFKKVRLKKIITKVGTIGIAVSLIVSTGTATASIDTYNTKQVQVLSGNFSDVPEGHWAYSAINNAVNNGYVSGYPDGTFKPNAEVTRAEFISMLVRAIGLEVGVSDIWYEPFVKAALDSGILQRGYGNYGQKMTRVEMAGASVRALGENVEKVNVAMFEAVQMGLITGVNSEGELDLWGTTTRAQSVAIIQRVLRVQRGEKLNVDQNAYEKAKDLVDHGVGGEIEPVKDQFGWAIREDNLPSNHADYPYILEDVPNEAYEMPLKHRETDRDRSPYITWNEGGSHSLDLASEHDLNMGIERITNYYNTILNVDYRTIEDDWGQDLMDEVYFPKPDEREALKKALPRYVEFVRDNKIAIEGNFEMIPSMTHHRNGAVYVRAKIEFSIKEVGNPEIMERNPDGSVKSGLIYYQRYDYNLFEIGKKYTMYTDVNAVRDSSRPINAGHWFGRLTPDRFNSIFGNYIIIYEEW